MGRKGIGKFSGFGIAEEIELETVKNGQYSRFVMNISELRLHSGDRKVQMPCLPKTDKISCGTLVTLRQIQKFHNRSITISALRRGLARRFSVIASKNEFEVVINGKGITPQERDLTRLLDKDADGRKLLWKIDEEIQPDTGWRVTGWIGALSRTKELEDGIQRGIVVMARGKLVQEPFVFDAVVGQQFALSYLVGELHAEFVDEAEDTISTTRNSLVWDTEANTAFKEWGRKKVNQIAREWGERRSEARQKQLEANPVYQSFKTNTERFEEGPAKRAADKLIREVVKGSPADDVKKHEPVIEMCMEFLEFDDFKELADELAATTQEDVPKILDLFRKWEVLEAKEMMKVTEGRIKTIEKLQSLIESDAMEVPTLHNFLKEFPWVLDPRWNLIADEKHFSKILEEKFPEGDDVLVEDKRIDFLCVRESSDLVVVEIKRPSCKAQRKNLEQIEEYVLFLRGVVKRTSEPDWRSKDVVGYLLVGDVVNTDYVREKIVLLENSRIYVRMYSDLLSMVKRSHSEFLKRYEQLRKGKKPK